MRHPLRTASFVAMAAALVALLAGGVSTTSATGSAPGNVDVSHRHLNESEESIAVNPTNPNNIVIVTNIGHREAGLTSGMFEAVSFDGGQTWTTSMIGTDPDASVGLAYTCWYPGTAFDG